MPSPVVALKCIDHTMIYTTLHCSLHQIGAMVPTIIFQQQRFAHPYLGTSFLALFGYVVTTTFDLNTQQTLVPCLTKAVNGV